MKGKELGDVIGYLSGRGSVSSRKCSLGIWRSGVSQSGFCLVGEFSIGNVSLGEVSVREMSVGMCPAAENLTSLSLKLLLWQLTIKQSTTMKSFTAHN